MKITRQAEMVPAKKDRRQMGLISQRLFIIIIHATWAFADIKVCIIERCDGEEEKEESKFDYSRRKRARFFMFAS